jgi:hypothetical protein
MLGGERVKYGSSSKKLRERYDVALLGGLYAEGGSFQAGLSGGQHAGIA